jgi:hypothetical protein
MFVFVIFFDEFTILISETRWSSLSSVKMLLVEKDLSENNIQFGFEFCGTNI